MGSVAGRKPGGHRSRRRHVCSGVVPNLSIMNTAEIIALGHAHGLDRVGICDAEPFHQTREDIEARRDSGLSDRLSFTFADPTTSTDVRRTFEWANRLVVGAVSYLPQAGAPGAATPGSGRIARFSTDDHYAPLIGALEAVGESLRVDGHRAEVLVDDNRLVDRAAAVRAGIGWWGKNTMVLTHRFGPWTLLGSVVTSADLQTTKADERSCGSCEACLPACPTGALIAPGVLDARRCIAALLQQRGSLPIELREAIGDRIYGCDDCLDACPPGVRLLESSRVQRGREDLAELLQLEDRELDQRFDRFYVPGRNMRFLRRNMLIALGNTGDASAIPLLEAFANSTDPLLAEHAIWALGQIGGADAIESLQRLSDVELDEAGDATRQSALTRAGAPIGK